MIKADKLKDVDEEARWRDEALISSSSGSSSGGGKLVSDQNLNLAFSAWQALNMARLSRPNVARLFTALELDKGDGGSEVLRVLEMEWCNYGSLKGITRKEEGVFLPFCKAICPF